MHPKSNKIETAEPLLRCVEVEPPGGAADAAVIWLHGLGADGHDFEPVVPQLGLGAAHRVRFVFPHAPRIPVTLNWGMIMPAWYDVRGLDLRRTSHDEAGILRNAARVEQLVARERERGVEPRRIVIAGFSQGGALAIHVALRYPERLAGLLALSCYLVLEDRLAAERSDANRDLPILQCHGTEDPMVPEHLGRMTAEKLRALGYGVRYHTWPIQHEVCAEELDVIGAWLRERLT